MSKKEVLNFSNLLKSLRAFTVIIIENAFQYVINPENILGAICTLPDNSRMHLLYAIKRSKHNELGKLVEIFYEEFSRSSRNYELEEKMPASLYLKKYLIIIGATSLNEDVVIEQIRLAIDQDTDDELKNTLLKYGVYQIDEANYNEIISEIDQVIETQILFFKKHPPDDKLNEFFEDISTIFDYTNSEFCLCIIDKKLGTGAPDAEGRDFIEKDLMNQSMYEKLRFICCLYTSTPEASQKLEEFKDYFIQEIGKADPQKIDNISKALATSAYARVFGAIRDKYRISSDKAMGLVLKNQKNIKYIIEEAIKEGIFPYEAIKHWFGLAQQISFENLEIADFKFIASLTNFFNDTHLDNHPGIGQIGKELKDLNAFELFDFNVNKKHLPIAPGDIWKAGDNYYVLMGQLCDFLLRDSNKRKARIGEFLKVTVEKLGYGDSNEKYFMKVEGDSKYIIIKHFIVEESNEHLSLKIDVSTSTSEFAELKVLDLSMFNVDGDCIIDMISNPPYDFEQVLAPNIRSYYQLLKNEFSSLFKMFDYYDIIPGTFLKSEAILISKSGFSYAEGKLLFDVKRIGRLKGRYFDSLYNNYLDNKGRIDLNLIDNSPEEVSFVQISCCFIDDPSSISDIINVNLWSKNSLSFFKRQELLKAVPSKYQDLISYCDEVLKVETGVTKYDIELEGEIYKLKLKYRLDERDNYQGKFEFSYSKLFGKGGVPTNPNFLVEGENQTRTFIGDKGFASVPISGDQMKVGVRIYEKKIFCQLVNGVIKIKPLED